MAGQSQAPGSRRRHSETRREFRLTTWFSARELDAIRRAAAAKGMAPAAYLAQLGTDAATATDPSRSPAPPGQLADAVAEMSAATEIARRHGYLLNQAVAALHSTGRHSPQLSAAADLVARAVRRMESATLAAGRMLR
jgi:hypothetical protein